MNFLLLLLQLLVVRGAYILLPQGDGCVYEKSDKLYRCINYEGFLNTSLSSGTIEKLKELSFFSVRRWKRGALSKILKELTFGDDEDEQFKKETTNIEKNLTARMKSLEEHMAEFEKSEREFEILENINRILSSPRLADIFDLVNVTTKDVANEFNFDENYFWELSSKLKLSARSESNKIIFSLCGDLYRRLACGEVNAVQPAGDFTNGNNIFRFFDLPRYEIYSRFFQTSASKCDEVKNKFFICSYDKHKDCTVANSNGCKRVSKIVPDGIFTQEHSYGTYVAAANLKKYLVRCNGNASWESMPESKQLFVSLPFSCFARFGNIQIDGRHEEMKILPMDVTIEHPEFGQEDLEELETQKGISFEEIEQLKEYIPSTTMDYFLAVLLKTVCVILGICLLIAALLAIIYNIIYCAIKV
ncbi:unnamed protein product [Caenorhabditis bovis]|uniref:Uncharacterized protein n=1 Tax=Caenorhabditis bovis TaxID=2654633 RepID=A0A8S1FBL6_9PELO|nr:unnamed protein product [Caenorhabditis bovis]